MAVIPFRKSERDLFFQILGLKAATMAVVNAGTNLSAARPAGVGQVYWKFDSGVAVGVNGASVTNRVPGDLIYVGGATSLVVAV